MVPLKPNELTFAIWRSASEGNSLIESGILKGNVSRSIIEFGDLK